MNPIRPVEQPTRPFRSSPWTVALSLAVLLAAAASWGAPTDPVCLPADATVGFDPMRQITTQFLPPNVVLTLDISGSMEWNVSGDSIGDEDNLGPGYIRTWGISRSSTSGCASNEGRRWQYDITFYKGPSRMVILKNALGNSVWLSDPNWTPGPPYPDGPRNNRFNLVTSMVTDNTQKWVYRYEYRSADNTCRTAPFNVNEFFTSDVVFPQPALTVRPQDLIGTSSDSVNWGLVTFHAGCNTANCGNGACTRVNVAPNSDDQSSTVATIEDYLRLRANGGLDATGSTPTRAALDQARTAVQAAYGTDQKRTCGRTFATILVTDGLSNNCNPGSDNWIDPCTGVIPYACDAGSSGYDCEERNGRDRNYTAFPPGKSEGLWDLKISGKNGADGVRTWVVGVSRMVSPCELNFTAYMGRTDASSPNGDAGFDYAHDTRLPSGAGDESRYDTATGDYAYFANSAADLKAAFSSILSSFGAGDYTTGAPVVTSSSSSSGMVSFVSSAGYPSWRGHLYAYDLAASCTDTAHWDCGKPCGWVDPNATDPDNAKRSNCLWDAGEILTVGALESDGTSRKGANNNLARKIYTWDPTNSTDPNGLVEVSAANIEALRTLYGCDPADTGCAFNTAVVDFIQGNNGSGSPRAWKLGAIVNSTPAIVGPPELWRQDRLESHSSMESTYENRHQLLWVGSSDGLLHAFDYIDGAEIVALIPPGFLAKQVELYGNYAAKPTESVTGEPRRPRDHLYGMANSPRFGDVWTGSEYKTVMYAAEGPGGTGVQAIDITHPFPGRDYDGDGLQNSAGESPDPHYGYSETGSPPVKVLWAKTRADVSDLGCTWSVPALGATDYDVWMLAMGGGVDERLVTSGVPKVIRFDAATGDVGNNVENLANQSSGTRMVNQSFADTVLWEKNSKAFYQDNVTNQGVQVDLQGQLWILEPSNYNPSRLFNVGAGEPLYYAPAVAAYPSSASPDFSLYAFGSGTLYERSRAINSQNTGTSGNFIPKLFIGYKNLKTSAVGYLAKPLKDIPLPTGQTGTLGNRTQLTSSAMIFTPAQGSSGTPFALFLVYDPDGTTCIGVSYIVRVDFDPANLNAATYKTYEVGPGASGGFALAGEKVVASHSDVGEETFIGQDNQRRATVKEVPEIFIPRGGIGGQISWWRELQ